MKLTIALTKIGQSIDVDTQKLCMGNESDTAAFDAILNKYPASVGYFFMYGCKKSLNDAHATVSHKPADIIRVASEKRLAAVYNGKVKTREGGTARELDPVAAEQVRLGKAWWKKQDATKAIANARAKYPALVNKTDIEVAAMLLGAFIRAPETLAKAKATVAAKSMQVEVELDLSDFMADEDESEDDSDDTLMIEDQT